MLTTLPPPKGGHVDYPLGKVGDDGYKKQPIGAGPYRFVSFTSGVELVLEAFDQYWRKPPSVKRLVVRVIPDHTTRVAALKRGEVDIAHLVSGELAENVRRTPGLGLKAVFPSTHWLVFGDQWDPKSLWADHERAVFGPIWDFAFLHGVGARRGAGARAPGLLRLLRAV